MARKNVFDEHFAGVTVNTSQSLRHKHVDSETESQFVFKSKGVESRIMSPLVALGQSPFTIASCICPVVPDISVRFSPDNVKEVKRLLGEENKETKRDAPFRYLLDVLHKTAFKGSPLGSPLPACGWVAPPLPSWCLF